MTHASATPLTRPYFMRGIRGAITTTEDTPAAIWEATDVLLTAMLERNHLQQQTDHIGTIFFTTTTDLKSAFPAKAARTLGLTLVPLMCGHEIPVPGALPRTIRIMMQVNTQKSQADIHHVFLRGATVLRPDLHTQ